MIDYGALTKRLHERAQRNRLCFPEDFMFQRTRAVIEAMKRSQIATGSRFWSLAMRRLPRAS